MYADFASPHTQNRFDILIPASLGQFVKNQYQVTSNYGSPKSRERHLNIVSDDLVESHVLA